MAENDKDKDGSRSSREGESGGEAGLPAEIQQALEQLPQEQRETLAQFVSLQIASHRGPIPSPESLGHYEQVRPGTADDIIGMAKAEQQLQADAVRTQLFHETFRISVAMVSVIGMIGIAGLAIWAGQPILAGFTAVASGALAAVRVIFARKE